MRARRVANLVAIAVVLALLFVMVLGASSSYRSAFGAAYLGACLVLLGRCKGPAS